MRLSIGLAGLQELRRFSAYGRLRKQLHQASDDYTKASKESCKYNTISYLFEWLGKCPSTK